IILIGLLTACGSSDDASTEGAEEEEATAEEEEATEAETEDEAAEETASFTTIEEGKLSFGSSGLFKPFNYEDLDGNMTGFEVDLGRALAEEMALEPNPVFTQDFGALIEEVNNDRI